VKIKLVVALFCLIAFALVSFGSASNAVATLVTPLMWVDVSNLG